ncbi:hypothetical protein IQ227_07715 [Anabaena aphanizomenioides LEGE 00250]|uniref:S1 motif domain-containing protein n=1 Tax=Sphaerospermopsis aphanizomenoides LEGE 00250 TaxID=2777972 RepID=A0ABR9VET2_9CYAN|nr:hypothetical protein [Sphaerospermopsis aphanizomenoides]MBE9235920.1 hypothetical protein [Sphaerospermopsis aphanizomenoides LEGE 00250]
MSLTDGQWEIAHAIAQTLVQEDTDVNEVGKILAYLRTIIDKSDATSRFLTYLKTLVKDGKQIGHSGKTLGYYRNIEITCSQYFKNNSDPHTILQILGWVSRLMRYYKDAGVPVGEIKVPAVQIAKPIVEDKFKIGEIVEATVIKIDKQHVQSGKKTKLRTIITYQIEGSDCQPDEEVNKQEVNLSIGDVVKVKIEKCQGSCIRKVKRVIE